MASDTRIVSHSRDQTRCERFCVFNCNIRFVPLSCRVCRSSTAVALLASISYVSSLALYLQMHNEWMWLSPLATMPIFFRIHFDFFISSSSPSLWKHIGDVEETEQTNYVCNGIVDHHVHWAIGNRAKRETKIRHLIRYTLWPRIAYSEKREPHRSFFGCT